MDKPKLILVGDEWCQGSYVNAVTSSNLCVENSFRKFFSVTNLSMPGQTPEQSIDILESYLRHIDLRGHFPRSNISIVYVLGNTFRDFEVPHTGVLDAHRRSVLNVLQRLVNLSNQRLPACNKGELNSNAGWWIVGGSTDIGGKAIEQTLETNENSFVPEMIHSWCEFAVPDYVASPLSNDSDRILVNSDISPSEHTVISMLLHKHQEYRKLQHDGWLSSDFIPTEMMTDVLAEHIHSQSAERFSDISYIGSRGLHDDHSRKHFK